MPSTSLRLMTANLENLFSPPNTFYGSTYTEVEYTDKINWISGLITRAQVHAVAVQELGDDADKCLSDICAAVNALDPTGWPPFSHQFAGEPSPYSPGIRCGVISRFPLSNAGSLTTYPDDFVVDLYDPVLNEWRAVPSYRFSRPIAHCTVNPSDDSESGNLENPFNLYVVHFKSKRPNTVKRDDYNQATGITRSAIQRNIEAAALRYYMDRFLPTQYETDDKIATIVVGDINDTPASVPAQNVRGPFEKVPGPASPWSEADKLRLLNCARLHLKMAAYEDKLFSYVKDENFSLIDQVFVTEHLVSRFKRFEAFNDHVFRHHDLSVGTDVDHQWKSRVSDHGAVVVEFTRMLKS